MRYQVIESLIQIERSVKVELVKRKEGRIGQELNAWMGITVEKTRMWYKRLG